MTDDEWNGIKTDLVKLINDGFGPILVRLAWHDAGTFSKVDQSGGPHATMNFKSGAGGHAANNGLSKAISLLNPLKDKYPGISHADLWSFAAACVVTNSGGPEITWRPGRNDAVDLLDSPSPPDRLPDATKGASHIREIFDRMGFEERDMVTLVGGHTFGRCHNATSGFFGAWTFEPSRFTNEFYQRLVAVDQNYTRVKFKNKDFGALEQFVDEDDLMMLPTDVSLVKDEKFRPIVEEYANSHEAFKRNFKISFEKLLELGVGPVLMNKTIGTVISSLRPIDTPSTPKSVPANPNNNSMPVSATDPRRTLREMDHSTIQVDAPIKAFSWHDLNYSINVKKDKEYVEKKLLIDMNGQVKAGQVVAIMGGSGAGKSTLLNTLAGRIGPGPLQGDILVDGKPRSSAMWKIQCAYVEQDDIMFSNLSVFETIRYSAFLRLPSSMDKKMKLDRVEQVIADLGLKGCRNTWIGDSNLRGISGGERKRVSIAVELVTNPQILFLDEPTSGLDAFNALNLIKNLKELALKENKIVLMTIHQPRTDILDLLDEIILLSQGKCIWSGKNEDAIKHFDSLGYKIPANTNPSDFYLDIATIDHRSDEQFKESEKRIETFVAAYDKIRVRLPKPSYEVAKESGRTVWPSSPLNEWLTLFERNMRDTVRNKLVIIATFGQNIFIAVFVGFISYQLPLNAAGIQSRTGILFFSCVNQTFNVIMPIINVFPVQREILKRERAAGSYRAASAYWAKVVASTPFPVIGSICMAVPFYWIVGLQANAAKFFTFVCIIIVQTFTANSLGLAIGASVPTVTIGQIFAPLVAMIFLIFAGLIVNLTEIPAALRWIQYLSFIAYSNKALNQNEFDNLTFKCDNNTTCLSDGSLVVKQLGFETPWLWHCVLINIGLAFGFLFIGYFGFNRASAPLMRLK